MKKFINILSVITIFALLLNITPVFAASNAKTYTVTLQTDSRVKYSGAKASFTIKSTAYKSVYAKLTASAEKDYYIEGINEYPENSADIKYNQKTGEVFIENVKNDFTIIPQVKIKSVPSSLDVSYDFIEGGIYSESNPAATIVFTANVSNSDGNPVPNTEVYFKPYSNESYTKTLKTDLSGTATAKYSYALEKGKNADFEAKFALDKSFSQTVNNISFNVILQKKSDLELYTNQVFASPANEKKGKVTGINPDYEYFTGVLHQGAINTASGEWLTPKKGEIDGLAPGQYALRFKERQEGNTIYLHSDYDYFTIDRAIWTVTLNASGEVAADNAKLYAGPGGDVYYYISVADGYAVSDYSVNKPNYIRSIEYNADGGYIHISGITGSIILNITSEEL